LEKVKLNKFEQKRKDQKERHLEEENSHCTFSPKLNKNKSNSILLGMPMLDRLVQYNKKKDISKLILKQDINYLQQVETQKDTKELSFSPKIIKNFKLQLEVAENVLQNPNSYHIFVDRLKNMRNSMEKQMIKHENAVGCGIHWRNKITVPKGPSFLTRPKLNRSFSSNYVLK